MYRKIVSDKTLERANLFLADKRRARQFLPERSYKVTISYIDSEKSYREVGIEFGLTSERIEQIVQKSLRKFEEFLKDEGFIS